MEDRKGRRRGKNLMDSSSPSSSSSSFNFFLSKVSPLDSYSNWWEKKRKENMEIWGFRLNVLYDDVLMKLIMV